MGNKNPYFQKFVLFLKYVSVIKGHKQTNKQQQQTSSKGLLCFPDSELQQLIFLLTS